MKYRRLRTTETTDAFSEFLAEHPGLWPRPNASGDTADPFNEFPAEPEPVDDRWLTVARGREMTAKVHDYRHALAAASVFLSIFMPAGIISTVIVGRQLAVTPFSGRASVPSSPESLVLASLETLPAVPAIDVPAPQIDLTAQRAAPETPRAVVATKPVQQIARTTERPQPATSPLTPQVSSPSNVLPLTSAVLSSAANANVSLPPPPGRPTPPSPAATTVTAPPPRLDSAVNSSAPPSGSPVVPTAPPAAAPAPPSAPVVTTTPPPTPAAPRAAGPNSAAENSAVRAALDRYRMAFSRLDAGSAKAVWPAVDERALSRAFNQMEEQQFVFDSCNIDVNGSRATASCRGRAQYIPKVGSRSLRIDLRQWAFTLRRTDQDWTIESVDSR